MPILVFLLLAASLSATTVRTDFEGGSLGTIQEVTPNHFRLSVTGEKDQDGRNRQASWYYFAVDHPPKGELILDMVDLPGEYNYLPNRGAITGATPPVISYDNKTWTHLTNAEYESIEPRLRLRIQSKGRSFRIAHVPPYTGEHLQKLKKEIQTHSDFQEEIVGKTLEGRDLRLWTIHHGAATGAQSIWLMFRQHSWEAGSSWVGEGAVRALLENTPEAAQLRSNFIWKIFPLCDPDGVARGGVRFNKNGFDLNRNWDITDPVRMPEITVQRDAVRRWLDQGKTVDLYLSLHNTETAEYLDAPTDEGKKYRGLAERVFQILSTQTSFAPTRETLYPPKANAAEKRGRMTVASGLYASFGIPAFLMEQKIAYNQKLGHFPNIPDRLRFGGELVYALSLAVQEK